MTSSMAFQGASSCSSSSFTHGWWTYDVFLSFRGVDTRNNFIAHLHDALDRKEINTYIDDNLTRGENISPALVKAIQKSRISVIVFSQNYASSSWCLDELVEIFECKEMRGQIVLPVFYKIHPSELRYQTKSVGEAFAKHEERFKDDQMKVQRWKKILTKVASLSGWHLENGNESKLIHAIVEDISKRVRRPHFDVSKYRIGIESRVKDINLRLNLEMNDTRMVGLFGIVGTGKTTLAKAIYNSINYQFQGSCFLENIRSETSERLFYPYQPPLVRLQERLLSEILRDSSLKVGNVEQGMDLIKEKLSFKKILLILDDVDQLLQLEALAGQCGWFGLGSRIIITTRDENVLTQHGVDRTYKMEELNGNEALRLFSWHAFEKDKPDDEYEKLTDRVIRYAGGLPLVLVVLGLFLHGRSVGEWRSALDRCKSIPQYDVTIAEHNTFMMHDLLQEMGTEIIQQDAQHVSEENTGGEKVEGMLDLPEKYLILQQSSFPKLKRLRVFLDLPDCLPYSIFGFLNPFKKIDELKNFNNMTSLGFFDCQSLIIVPDLSNNPNFRELILDRCTNLVEVHDSVGLLDKLISLRISRCNALRRLPNILKLTSLIILEIKDCRRLRNFPEIGCKMEYLRSMDLRHTAIKELPSSIKYLIGLEDLNLEGCANLMNLPSIIHLLQRLKNLILVDCQKLEEIPRLPPDIQEVNARGCISLERFSEVSKRFESNTYDLPGLVWVDLSRCHKLLENIKNDVKKFLSVKQGNLEDYICSIIFPGSKIPNWISHKKQASNSDICVIDITEASYLDGEITGMILCAIIGLKDESQIPFPIPCTVQIINGYTRHFEVKKFHLSGSDHLWLQYYIPKFDELKGDNVQVKFQIWHSTGLAFFRSCGVHLVRRYEGKEKDQMLNAPDEAVENSVVPMELDGIQLNKKRREGHIYFSSYCQPQKRHCGALGIRISGTDNIQEHQSTSLNPQISKGKILTKDKVRVKGPRLRSSFHGCLGVGVAVGVGIGLRFKMHRPRKRKIQKVISNLENNYSPRRERPCGTLGIKLSGPDNIQEHRSTSLNPQISKGKILTKDTERLKAPPLLSSFHGGLRGISVGVGIGIGLRFKNFQRRRRTERKGIKSKI